MIPPIKLPYDDGDIAELVQALKTGKITQGAVVDSVEKALVAREDTKIEEEAIVGIGSVVIRDVPPKTVVVGNPAQVLRKLE